MMLALFLLLDVLLCFGVVFVLMPLTRSRNKG